MLSLLLCHAKRGSARRLGRPHFAQSVRSQVHTYLLIVFDTHLSIYMRYIVLCHVAFSH